MEYLKNKSCQDLPLDMPCCSDAGIPRFLVAPVVVSAMDFRGVVLKKESQAGLSKLEACKSPVVMCQW